jgi:integrase
LRAISQNRWFPKSEPENEVIMNDKNPENPLDCASQNGKAKSRKGQIVAQIVRLVRKAGLDYDGWRYVAKKVRQVCELRPMKRSRKLPRVLNADEFRKFYQFVDRADDVQHSLMLRLLFFTAVRVSELCNMQVADVDLENYKIRINGGKNDKDRYVLFGKSFATALRTHIAAHPSNRWLFQTKRATKYSTRRVQQIVKLYAEEAGVQVTPHGFRHMCLTWLTRHSGLADAEIQLISGHSRRESLALYQHIALDGQLEEKYHESMKKVEL